MALRFFVCSVGWRSVRRSGMCLVSGMSKSLLSFPISRVSEFNSHLSDLVLSILISWQNLNQWPKIEEAILSLHLTYLSLADPNSVIIGILNGELTAMAPSSYAWGNSSSTVHYSTFNPFLLAFFLHTSRLSPVWFFSRMSWDVNHIGALLNTIHGWKRSLKGISYTDCWTKHDSRCGWLLFRPLVDILRSFPFLFPVSL